MGTLSHQEGFVDLEAGRSGGTGEQRDSGEMVNALLDRVEGC
jgi:hypothetical protein